MCPTKILIYFIIFMVIMDAMQVRENFSNGALVQLYAKGPQDTYHTADAEKWWRYWGPYWWGYPYGEAVWNNPTRYRRYTPYGGVFPRWPYNHFYPHYTLPARPPYKTHFDRLKK